MLADGLAEGVDPGFIEAEQRDHAAFARLGGLLHELAAALHETQGVLERQRAGQVQGGVFAETQTAHHVEFVRLEQPGGDRRVE